ncbi:hypothetical protein ACFTZK_31230 [Streptomyces decoyicus]|uniref:hypothetical protein n=1 Tax=Streptomyces decoyicus TaxID=249567 RepID=UPI0036459B81
MAISKKLAAALKRDDEREDAGMHADDRVTCYSHQSWAEDCEGRHLKPTAGSLLAEHNELQCRRQQ